TVTVTVKETVTAVAATVTVKETVKETVAEVPWGTVVGIAAVVAIICIAGTYFGVTRLGKR
ncbi:MAG: hypothetical protein QXG84_07200, partial [Ignisphaera sp.]